MVHDDRDDQRQTLTRFSLPTRQLPDFEHVAQQLQGDEAIRSAFMLKEEVDKGGSVSAEAYFVEQVGMMPGLLRGHEGVLADGQSFKVDMPRNVRGRY